MNDKLRPCPFCGDKKPNVHQCSKQYWVECVVCHANTMIGKNEQLAIRAWNIRPIEDGLRARIAELEAALKWYADRANYAENPNADLRYIEGGPGTIVDADYGKRAREALKDDK